MLFILKGLILCRVLLNILYTLLGTRKRRLRTSFATGQGRNLANRPVGGLVKHHSPGAGKELLNIYKKNLFLLCAPTKSQFFHFWGLYEHSY